MTGEINTKTFFKEIQKTGLSITHFSKKKPSLEEQFLSLTQTKEDATPRN